MRQLVQFVASAKWSERRPGVPIQPQCCRMKMRRRAVLCSRTVCVLDRFAEQVAGRRGVAWSLIIATRGKEEACFAFRRVNYGRRGSVARRAERKHDLSLRVVRDTGHEREASGRDGTKDRRARRHAVGGTDRATSPCTKEERQE